MPEVSQRDLDEQMWKAAEAGQLEKVQELKKAGANPNWMHPQEPAGRAYQFTALHIASDKEHIDVVKWLVEKGGADLNKKCSYGESAMQHVDGRSGKEAIHSYLKMKTAMLAVMAAQKFAALQKKPKE